MVLATQNPIEEEGTYVLPQAQMDRFLLKEVVEYPDPKRRVRGAQPLRQRRPRQSAARSPRWSPPTQVELLQRLVQRVYVDPVIKRYIVDLVQATRNTEKVLGPELGGYVEIGASPRGTIAFYQVARGLAVLNGRNHVIPEDVRQLRHSVLRHRLHLNFEALAERVPPEVHGGRRVRRRPDPVRPAP